ncbi:MAG: hypothetical protein ONB23_02520 [candidate division KSB1 bacterium]|nr:hypothetical protein [candidate division KSB1 bacterium]
MELAYRDWTEMRMGKARRPVQAGGVSMGQGLVIPEINYTLPPMLISRESRQQVERQFDEIVQSLLDRAAALKPPALVLEFEHLPALTQEVDIGVQITRQTAQRIADFSARTGIPAALRVTVSDLRDMDRPPRMRTGTNWDLMRRAFDRNARAGAAMLSIESTGGKEVHDVALMEGNVEGILFSLGVLGCRDMHHLWRFIVDVARASGSVPAGDTACGFANTAMVLADRGYLPQTLAAVDRAMGAARSLVAYLEGAVGPSKDCAYEGPILKALLGIPISMEGKTAACAHLSHVGNVAAAVCDLWSNESVQNVQLLSGPAPVAFLEMLVYDCRLFNRALQDGQEASLIQWLVESDLVGSPQAWIISPQGAFRIARAMAAENDDFARTRAAGLEACRILREAKEQGSLPLGDREWDWLDRIEEALAACDTEEKAVRLGFEAYRHLFLPEEYGL